MALVKQTLETALKQAFDGVSDTNIDPAQGRVQMAAALANAIDAFVRSGTVTGTCATPAGAGTIAGTIS